MRENKLDFIDVIEALNKSDLSPLVVPALRLIDPICMAIPQGAIKEYLSSAKPRAGQFDLLYKFGHLLPGAITIIGRIAQIKAITIPFAIFATLAGSILKLIQPLLNVALPVGAAIIRNISKPVAMLLNK